MSIENFEQLNNILEEKDGEIYALKEHIESLEFNNNAYKWQWMKHSTVSNSGDREGLPFPRIEMILSYEGDYFCSYEYVYGIVYKNFGDVSGKTDNLSFIPISVTTGNGNNIDSLKKLELPNRDGFNIKADMRLMKLPGYIVCPQLGISKEIECDLSDYHKGVVDTVMSNTKSKYPEYCYILTGEVDSDDIYLKITDAKKAVLRAVEIAQYHDDLVYADESEEERCVKRWYLTERGYWSNDLDTIDFRKKKLL